MPAAAVRQPAETASNGKTRGRAHAHTQTPGEGAGGQQAAAGTRRGIGGMGARRARRAHFPQFTHPRLGMTVIHPWGALYGALGWSPVNTTFLGRGGF